MKNIIIFYSLSSTECYMQILNSKYSKGEAKNVLTSRDAPEDNYDIVKEARLKNFKYIVT